MAKKPKHVYTASQMAQAVAAVKRGMGVWKASATFKVPKTTLYDNTKGKYRNVAKRAPGPGRALGAATEQALVDYALYMAERGFPLTRPALKALTRAVVSTKGLRVPFNMENGPSDKWIRSLLRRHKELSLRSADTLDNARANLSQEEVNKFFILLQNIKVKYDLSPNQIFNVDETGFSGKETFRGKVVAKRGAKKVYQRPVRFPGHVTVVLAASAVGAILPPLVIFEGSLPGSMQGIPPSWAFTATKSGFIDSAIFLMWFRDVFLQQCGRQRPLVLIMDNHVSHLGPEVIDLAKKEQIELLCLPPHSTHLLQPLDVGVFNLLKRSMANYAVTLGYGGMRAVPKNTFPNVLKVAIDRISSAVVKSAFRTAGIFPLKPVSIPIASTTCAMDQEASSDSNAYIQKCQTCGQDRVNPLVRLGIVPQELATVLVSPPEIPCKRKSKKPVLSARLLTTTDFVETPGAAVDEPTCPGPDAESPAVTVDQPTSPMPGPSRTNVSSPAPSSVSDEADNEVCCICNKWSPPGLRACQNITIVNWAQCDRCSKWCHLRFCTSVVSVSDKETFFCPLCNPVA